MDSKTKWRREHREHIRVYNKAYRASEARFHLCDCGRIAFTKKGSSWVCKRCHDIENYLHTFHRYKDMDKPSRKQVVL